MESLSKSLNDIPDATEHLAGDALETAEIGETNLKPIPDHEAGMQRTVLA